MNKLDKALDQIRALGLQMQRRHEIAVALQPALRRFLESEEAVKVVTIVLTPLLDDLGASPRGVELVASAIARSEELAEGERVAALKVLREGAALLEEVDVLLQEKEKAN